MRQAGRYLPEYRELRKKTGDFLTMCYTPEIAAEVTLQPIRRFNMNAAIIFSDILVIPHAAGMKVWFEQGEGPRLETLKTAEDINNLKTDIEAPLRPVFEALKIVRKELPKETSLIGFCGAPWTVACYMLEGKTRKEYEHTRQFAIQHREDFSKLIDKLVQASISYLSLQIEAGADVIQIFDSWSGVLSEQGFMDWVVEPTRKIVSALKTRYPGVPVIGFPRGAGVKLSIYEKLTGVNAVGIDTQTSISWAAQNMNGTIQGNLDPLLYAHDKKAMLQQATMILEATRNKPFVFNLGHGIVPSTPIENVEALCQLIRDFK